MEGLHEFRAERDAAVNTVFVYGILLRDAIAPARLEGWRLEFWDGLATVVPHEGAHVDGGVVDVAWERLKAYDGIEGVSPRNDERGLYRREEVTLDNGDLAWVYRKNVCEHRRPPFPSMLAGIHRALLALGHDDLGLVEAVERAH